MSNPPTQPEKYESAYRAMIINLRAALVDETDCLYFLHTPMGAINVRRWHYPTSPGFVGVTGDNESGKTCFFVFPEEVIRTYPLEVRRKKQEALKDKAGFARWFQGGTEDPV